MQPSVALAGYRRAADDNARVAEDRFGPVPLKMRLADRPRGRRCSWRVSEAWAVLNLPRQPAGAGIGSGISFASFWRFWAAAARKNSSRRSGLAVKAG